MKSLFALFTITIAFLLASCSSENNLPGGSGMIEATEVTVSAQAAGQLLTLNFDRADSIKTTDTIALIDTLNTVLRLHQVQAVRNAAQTQLKITALRQKQAESNLSLAEKEFNRVKTLLQSGSANQQQYDKVENAYDQAALAVKQARAAHDAAMADLNKADAEIDLLNEQLNNCRPTAPVYGRVLEKYVEEGELVGIGSPIIKIGKLDTVWVKVYLPPSDLTGLKLGAKANVDPEDGRDSPLEGYISWISSEAEFTPKNVQTKEARADLVYAVKISIPNPDERLKIGMPVMVTIP